jgi:hypothetical protein
VSCPESVLAGCNVITVQAALSMMAADAATGMNFTGSFVPVKWSAWLNLPARPEDDCIGTPSRNVRVAKVASNAS